LIRFFYSSLTYLLFPFVKKRLKRRFDKDYLFKRLWKGNFEVKSFDFIIQAASVGEQTLISALVKKLADDGNKVLLTSATETGYKISQKTAEYSENITVEFLPFDLYFSVKRFFKYRKTKKLILVETEIWINLIEEAHLNNIEIFIVNGRISDSSFKTYTKLNFLFKKSLNKISKCLARYETDAKRFEQLGVNKENIQVTGNLKLSMNPTFSEIEFNVNTPVIVFGSTRDGEEEIILDSVIEFIKTDQITVVLAPRHPERTVEVAKLCKGHNLEPVFSKDKTDFNLTEKQIIIVNETGRLLSFYKASSLCFVGGSLIDFGGQNFIEPIFFEKPVITGKFLNNFLDILPIFESHLTVVDNVEELNYKIQLFLNSPSSFQAMAQKSKEILSKQQDALSITLKEITDAN